MAMQAGLKLNLKQQVSGGASGVGWSGSDGDADLGERAQWSAWRLGVCQNFSHAVLQAELPAPGYHPGSISLSSKGTQGM